MGLLLFLTTAALEFHASSQKRFARLKQSDADNQAVAAAMNTIRLDLLKSGLGLSRAADLGTIDPIHQENGVLEIRFVQTVFATAADLAAGQTRLTLEPRPAFAAGRQVCVVSETGGEIRTVSSIEGRDIILAAPLDGYHPAQSAEIALVERLTLSMDRAGRTLRRRANTSPAQPLMEEVAVFLASYDPNANLVRVEIAGRSQPEKNHVLLVFPKNTARHLRPGL